MLLELHEKRELDDTDDFIDKHQLSITGAQWNCSGIATM